MAFPRRLASHLTKSPEAGRLDHDSGWDKALVRHLYDVHKIVKAHPQTALDLAGLRRTVRIAIDKDASHFANQHPAFAAGPQKVMLEALARASASGELQAQYEKFAADMVYAPAVSVPRFHEALDTFQSLLEAILQPRGAIAH